MAARRKNTIPTIGFQIPSFTQPYHRHLWNGVNDIVMERKANLITFWGETYKYPHYYCYQGNTIYSKITSRNLDGVIISSGSICNFAGSNEEFYNFYAPFRDIPIVSLSIAMKDIPSVVIDNTIGFRKAIEHLVVDHGYRKFAFLHGPKNNPEAMLRYSAYQATLRKHGIPEDRSRLFYGDFTRLSMRRNNLVHDIRAHIDDIEVIVSSNDNMLIGLIIEFEKYKIRIPDHVAAIGFDNIMEASFITPPLTTVNQPIYRQARLAGEVLFDMLDGKRVDPVYTLPTEPVIRNSCGCSHPADYGTHEATYGDRGSKRVTSAGNAVDRVIEEINAHNMHLDAPKEKVVRAGIDDILHAFHLGSRAACMKKINTVIDRCLRNEVDITVLLDIIKDMKIPEGDTDSATLYRDILLLFANRIKDQKSIYEVKTEDAYFEISWTIQELSANIGFENILAKLDDELGKMGVRTYYFNFFDKPVRHTINAIWQDPEHINLHLYRNGKPRRSAMTPIRFSSRDIVPKRLLTKRFNLILTPLYFMEDQFGYALFEADDSHRFVYNLLLSLINNLLYASILYRDRLAAEEQLQEVLNEVKTYNVRLKEMSEKDELTGIYNRRGFTNLANEMLETARRESYPIILFFIDIDRLKKINDDHGHEEGDFAIRACSEILRNTFRNIDIIARIGGDEFVVLASHLDTEVVERICARLETNVGAFNRSSGKPYQIEMSIGWIASPIADYKSLDSLFREADTMMYRIKKMKRDSPSAH